LMAATVMVLLIAPWVGWLLVVGGSDRTQVHLLLEGNPGLLARLVPQSVFYLQRIPDQLTGPLVEIATVMRRSPAVEVAANLWAVPVSAMSPMGWLTALLRPRRRLAALIPLLTLGLLLVWPYTEAGRFLIPLVPCLLIGGVEGLTCLARLAAGSVDMRMSR